MTTTVFPRPGSQPLYVERAVVHRRVQQVVAALCYIEASAMKYMWSSKTSQVTA